MNQREKTKKAKQMKSLLEASGLGIDKFATQMGVNKRSIYAWFSGQNAVTDMALKLAGYVVRDAVGA